jgi:protein-S-isoprenylcysteine O-methyltransferase Ste14
MASPFAVYFYSAYKPALNFFNVIPGLGWFISFFMPHAVRQTSSPFINSHEIIGVIFAVIGFAGFCIGAFQVYYHKLAKKGAVTGGIYNFVRHPQYACFMLCSFGLLILWPRYIVLFMFVTMTFAYYYLARAEERECTRKFGSSYVEYMKQTCMFLPFRIKRKPDEKPMEKSRLRRFASILGIYISVQAAAFGLAYLLNILSLNSLYGIYTNNTANISISEMKTDKLQQILDIAASDLEVKTRLEPYKSDKLLNYVLPAQWYVAEIPMSGIISHNGHASPANYHRNLYKIIFTKAEMRSHNAVSGKDIIKNVKTREGLAEVWVDLKDGKVIKNLRLNEGFYKDTPVAIY